MKPYSLQAPEDIAKEYGGNKQKIAEAARMGLVDPTAAVMAGMFIDRMRGAQAQEQAQQPTVAEQVFNTPQPALGATPQAAQMQAMQQEYAPRPGVTGMDRIPVDPNMMPSAAGGGLVAFAAGDMVEGGYGYNGLTIEDQKRLEKERAINKYVPNTPLVRPELQDINFDMGTVTQENLDALKAMLPEGTPRAELMQYYSPEEVSARTEAFKEKTAGRAKEDLWTAVALGGLSAAAGAKPSTGSLLGDLAQTLGTAGTAAAPYLLEGMKAKRAAEDKATAMQEEGMTKRLELAIADRQEQIALLTPAFNAATGEKKAAYEKQIAKYTAEMNLFKSELDNISGLKKQEIADIAAEKRARIAAEASKEAQRIAATLKGPTDKNRLSNAIYDALVIKAGGDDKVSNKDKILFREQAEERAAILEAEAIAKAKAEAAQVGYTEGDIAAAQKDLEILDPKNRSLFEANVLEKDPQWSAASRKGDRDAMQLREQELIQKEINRVALKHGIKPEQIGGTSESTTQADTTSGGGETIYMDSTGNILEKPKPGNIKEGTTAVINGKVYRVVRDAQGELGWKAVR